MTSMTRMKGKGAVRLGRVGVCLTLLLAGCGGGDEGGGGGYSGSGGSSGGGDAGIVPYCEMALAVSPAQPTAPGTLSLTANIVRSGDLSGLELFSWEVLYDGTVPATEVPWTLADPDGRRINAAMESPGIYRIRLAGSVGETECFESSDTITAIRSGARIGMFRLRLSPGASQPAPVQERLITVYGGADADLGILTLDSGMAVSGQIRSPAGVPVPSYMRILPATGEGPGVEAFANADGRFSVLLRPGTYDVLVIPTAADMAPLLVRSATASQMREITLTQGERVEGVVRDPAGAPMADARVSLRTNGVPSTLATTDASGRFTLYARAGSSVAVTVVPPLASGLPILELGEDAGLSLGASALAIDYAPDLRPATLTLRVDRVSGSEPAPGARVTLSARAMAAAGTVTGGNGARAAAGVMRHSAVADEGGMLGPLVLPEAVYDVIIEPSPEDASGGGISVHTVDLSAPPSSLSLAGPAYFTGTVVSAESGGERPLAGIALHATPLGLLAGVLSSRAQTSSAADGTFSLPVTSGDSYNVVWSSRDRRHAQAALQVTAPASGQSIDLGNVALGPAIAVRGRIENQGGAGVPGVSLSLLCYQCTGVDADRPIAQAVTSASGTFVLAVPDPGVDPTLQPTPSPSPGPGS